MGCIYQILLGVTQLVPILSGILMLCSLCSLTSFFNYSPSPKAQRSELEGCMSWSHPPLQVAPPVGRQAALHLASMTGSTLR